MGPYISWAVVSEDLVVKNWCMCNYTEHVSPNVKELMIHDKVQICSANNKEH